MKDFLGNTIQLEDIGIRVDTSPKWYDNDSENCQTVLLPGGKVRRIF